jgi:hypothetical protein
MSQGRVKEDELPLKNILVKNEVDVVAQWLRGVDISRIGAEKYAR